MKNQNTRRSYTQNCSPKGFTRPSSSRNVSMRDIGASHTLYPALQACGVTARVAHGFTLIELLVVVLIIGILAAVALPQYQKAVEKSRMIQGITLISEAEKAVDAFLLESPTLDNWEELCWDETACQRLNITFPCKGYGANGCYLGEATGKWRSLFFVCNADYSCSVSYIVDSLAQSSSDDEDRYELESIRNKDGKWTHSCSYAFMGHKHNYCDWVPASWLN